MAKLTLIVLLFALTGCGLNFNLTLPSADPIFRSTSPKIESVSQNINAFGGTSVIVVQGVNFVNGMQLKINGHTCTSTALDSATQLTCTITAIGKIGLADIELVHNGEVVATATSSVSTFAVYGQANATTNSTLFAGLSSPFAMKKCGTKLMALDSGNHRLLVWNNSSVDPIGEADFILGQPLNLNTCNGSNTNPSASTFCSPYGFTCTADKLIVADTLNRRVLIWSSLPTSSASAPNVVLGQTDFESKLDNSGGLSDKSMRAPAAVEIDKNGRLYVAEDFPNSRVMIYDSIPTTSFSSANHLLGQSSFTASTATTTAALIKSAVGVTAVDNYLFLVDRGNHRVLVWNNLPTGIGPSADAVIGQINFTANAAAATAKRLNEPTAVASDGTALYISDSSNNRVIAWSTIAAATGGLDAGMVLGQSNFTAATANPGGISASTLQKPASISVESINGSTKLFIADQSNHRILVWNTLPTTNAQAANAVIGQPHFQFSRMNWSGNATYALQAPRGVYYQGGKLLITDSGKNRVLIWNSFPSSLTTPPDVVLGQANFSDDLVNAGNAAPSARTMNNPRNIWLHNNQLFVADSGNNRVMVWNTFPTTTYQPADFVLGQPDPITGTVNTGGVSSSSMNSPSTVIVAGGRLYVADSVNHRVLIWSGVPTSAQAAVGVIGQPDLLTATSNYGGISASSLRNPVGLDSDGIRLAVADANNNRVLIWSALPTSQTAANFVIGQPSMASDVANESSLTPAQKISTPIAVNFFDGKFYLNDRGNNRILKFDVSALASQAAASKVIGQADMTGSAPNGGGAVSLTRFKVPEAIQKFPGGLAVTDSGNNRIVFLPDTSLP